MKIFKYLLLFFVISSLQLNAQNKKVLFTVNDDKVTVDEFTRVYNKNLDLVKDETQKDIDEYLRLYVEYKLKLQEAKALGLDKKETYLREFNGYKKQLAKNYLSDSKITDKLITEAYERISNDVNVDHVLITLNEAETDTTAVYNQIMTIRDEFVKADNFQNFASSVRNGDKVIAESLGWFSGFRMVYRFETAAFNTPIGEVSMPFRTRFGYHILKVNDKRKSLGTAEAGHIFFKETDEKKEEKKLNDIYNLLTQGQAFEDLAKQFSEDKASALKGGKIQEFKSSEFSAPVFEKEVFNLKEGEYSKPFKSKFGWHIVKLYNKQPIAPFEELKRELTIKVKKDHRSKIINEVLINKLKKQYNVPMSFDLSYFETILNDTFYSNTWSVPTSLDQNKILVDFGDKQITYLHFANHLESIQKMYKKNTSYSIIVNSSFKTFLDKKILEYHEGNLENVNPEYAAVIKEYRDGLLLFDLMQSQIWDAVANDSVALQKHYNQHKASYIWPQRIDATILSTSDKTIAERVQKSLMNNMSVDDIKAEFNNNTSKQSVITTQGKFTQDHYSLPKDYVFKEGVSDVYFHNNTYHVIYVTDILPDTEKTFEEAKGKVISEYQEIYEKEWIESLKEKYSVDVNKKVLKKVKRQLQ